MMVAWHEMPGMCDTGARPVGYGTIGWREGGYRVGWYTKRGATDHTVPYGTGHACAFSRHFVPGYHHSVPTGQRLVFLG